MNNKWTMVCMYTNRYKNLLTRLQQSCETHKVPFHSVLVPTKAYREVIAYKPSFMRQMLRELKTSIVYIDADFEVHEYPKLFDNPQNNEFMVYNWYADRNNFINRYDPNQLLCSSGVMYWKYTNSEPTLLQEWGKIAQRNQLCADDQLLDKVFNEGNYIKKINYQWLPQSYLRIAPFFPNTSPVLNHQDHPGKNGPQAMDIKLAK